MPQVREETCGGQGLQQVICSEVHSNGVYGKILLIAETIFLHNTVLLSTVMKNFPSPNTIFLFILLNKIQIFIYLVYLLQSIIIQTF